jgi:hypothetical protein
MAPRPPASERARARFGSLRARRLKAVTLVLAAGALGGACRQTVVLDPSAVAALDGGGGGAGGPRPLGDGGPDGDKGGNGGGGSPGNHSDGGHPDLPPFCFGGQIQSLTIAMHAPDIIVSVDRSSSMQSWFGAGTQLQVVQQQVRALVAKYRVVKFGYEEFPSPTGMCSNGQGCCAGAVTLPSYNNGRGIDNAIHACDNGGPGCDQTQRPIADALSNCNDTFASLFSPDDPGHRYVLLMTSGDPTCGSSSGMTAACDDAKTQLAKLNRSFVSTAVFGVGDGAAGSACLDMLATYGGLESGGPSPLYHLAKTPNDLSSALDPVVETIAEEACKFDVRSPPADPKKVQLLFDGVPVPNDPVDGWTFDADTTVSLTVHGSYCRTLVQNANKVELIAGCPVRATSGSGP